jgi:hypothetical protein
MTNLTQKITSPVKSILKSSICALTLLVSGQAWAVNYESITTSLSNFTDGTKWAVTGTTTCGGGSAVGGTIPSSSSGNDAFTICPGHTLTLDADFTFDGYGIQVLGTLNLSNATLITPPNMAMAGVIMIGNAAIFGSPTNTGLPNTGQLISGTRPHEFFVLATARGSQTQLGNSKVSILFVDTEALALSAANIIDLGIMFSGSGTITGTVKFTDGSLFGNQGIEVDAAKILPIIDISAFTGTTGAGKTLGFGGAFNNSITSLKLPTTLGTEIKFTVPESQTLTINSVTGSSMSCIGSATAGTTSPSSTAITSAPFVFNASTTAGSTSTFVCTTISPPAAVSAPIDFSFSHKKPEIYSREIKIK